MKYFEQYPGSAIKFKSRFKIHMSDVKTKKYRFGTVSNFNNKCCHSFLHFVCIFTCSAH